VPPPSGSTIPISVAGGQPAPTSTTHSIALPVSYKLGPSSQSLYLLLVVAAAVTLLGSWLIRFMSIRLNFSPSKPQL
jgi:putative effector of murein hydrolase